MIKAENLIIAGEYFLEVENSLGSLKKIKSKLTSLMQSKGYAIDVANIFEDFLTLRFDYDTNAVSMPLPRLMSVRKEFGLISREELIRHHSDDVLSKLIDSTPHTITLNFTQPSKENNDGFLVKVRVEPILYLKIRKLMINPNFIDEFRYSDIVNNCINFADDIMQAIGAKKVKDPKPIDQINKVKIAERLTILGFQGIAEKVLAGNKKLVEGKVDGALNDLRNAYDLFLVELVKKIGETSDSSSSRNIKILCEKGYLNKNIGVLLSSLDVHLYKYLSGIVHAEKPASLGDAEFIFDFMELIFNALLDRIVFQKN